LHSVLRYTDAQSVATQRLLPVGVPRGVSAAVYAKAMTRTLRWLRKAAGVK
jgi:succinate-semialdehyde dehydrogenase/glutarate-semialdehyde dehydrogenase